MSLTTTGQIEYFKSVSPYRVGTYIKKTVDVAGYSAFKPCLFPAIGNRYLNKTKTFQRVCVTKFERIFGATLAALARGFSDRHFERGEGPGDEVAVYTDSA